MIEAELGEDFGDATGEAAARDGRGQAELRRERDNLADGERRQQDVFLSDVAHHLARPLAEAAAVERDRAAHRRARRADAGDQVEEGRFPRARRPHNGDGRLGIDGATHVAEDDAPAWW